MRVLNIKFIYLKNKTYKNHTMSHGLLSYKNIKNTLFEGDFADTCAEEILLVSMGGQADQSSQSAQVEFIIIY